jgi:type I restriction enzyme, R subunit
VSEQFNESEVEEAALSWLSDLGYAVEHGAAIAPGEAKAARDDYREVVLRQRLRASLVRLNSDLPAELIEEAIRKLTRTESPSLVQNNRAFHRMLIEGVTVEHRRTDGSISGVQVRLIDFENPENNDWLAVNQFTIEEGQNNRRPDIELFVNGLPLGVVELKNATDESATIWSAFNQLQNYKREIPSLYTFNEALVVSDGLEARIGSLTADHERFMKWRTIEGDALAPASIPQLQVLIKGVFDKRRFLDLIRHFAVFDDNGAGEVVKVLAGYHQFHAVQKAVGATLKAADARGDKRCGVVWHTQGSGKSLTMLFYAGRLILEPKLENPTIVVITDRNDLDDQLFGTFSRCKDLLRQTPANATSRPHLRQLLKVAHGGVVFTTVQKFFPEEKGDRHPLLSDRRNIIVIADEAHRSQYDFIDGFAKHMRDALPNASFIGFTGTPIELTDKNTKQVFGDYIDVYDIQRAVDDGATVPIYYEARLAKLDLKESERPKLDPNFEEVTEGEEEQRKEKLKTKWAALEAVVGSEKRIKLIAQDLVKHFDARQLALEGKAMAVCMSRRICVDLYREIVKLRPEWHDDDLKNGAIKVVMTGTVADPPDWQLHIHSKKERETLADRFRNPTNPLKLVLVRDMWLTGFDAPPLHTMYVDKPMRGHGLMQAIARVNRVFKDKPGGLIVDYLGLAYELKRALAAYTEGGGKGKTAIDIREAVIALLKTYEVCCNLFHGFDWSIWKTGRPAQRLGLLPQAQEHILSQENGKERYVKAVSDVSKAFALAVPTDEALKIEDDVAFFQAVRAALTKSVIQTGKSPYELDHAIRQIVSRAVSSDEVIDIFTAAGLRRPDISILSDDFLAEVKGMPQKNLAVELLEKLLKDEIKTRTRKNLVQRRLFSDMLEASIRKYKARTIESAKVIEELIALAKDMRKAEQQGATLGLSEDEHAFYDALEVNDSAVKVLGDDTLKTIARELVDTVKRNASIDWTIRENVRAKLRVAVRRILRKHGYPPDKQENATRTVIEQAELICADAA